MATKKQFTLNDRAEYIATGTTQIIENFLRQHVGNGNLIVRSARFGECCIGYNHSTTEPGGSLEKLTYNTVRDKLLGAIRPVEASILRSSGSFDGTFPIILSESSAIRLAECLQHASPPRTR